jgi:glycosyltransferase involved in cell wall biosynthesis
MISVVILTLNEEDNLPDCLASVAWADDVLVLDSGSTDCTQQIAYDAGARVMERSFDDFASQRNYGLREGDLRHDWVLHLDADERVTPDLRRELKAVAEGGSNNKAFRIPSRMIFRDTWLKHAGMYPTYQVRFGRREALTFKQVGHGQRGDLPAECIGKIDTPLLHYVFSKGIGQWFERHNRYSTDEAKRIFTESRDGGKSRSIDWNALLGGDATRRRRALKDLSFRLPFRPLFRFLYMYVWRCGFLDGGPGFTYCMLVAIYEYMTMLKVSEKQRRQPKKGEREEASLPSVHANQRLEESNGIAAASRSKA